MTIVSSASTARRWTNRESLHKDQDSWNKDSCRKGKQNSRFPVRILPTRYDARTRRYRKCKCRGGKEHLHRKRVGWRRGRGHLRWLWELKFRTIRFCPIRLGRIGWSNLSWRKVKRPLLMQLGEMHEDVGRYVGIATSALVQAKHL